MAFFPFYGTARRRPPEDVRLGPRLPPAGRCGRPGRAVRGARVRGDGHDRGGRPRGGEGAGGRRAHHREGRGVNVLAEAVASR